MSPRRTSHTIPSLPNQPAFVEVVQSDRGALTVGEVNPDGVPGLVREQYVPPTTVTEGELAASAAFATTLGRRAAQRHRHSALDDETGQYTDVRPGKVLPGFGIVTYGNLGGAKVHAAKLNRERLGTDEERGSRPIKEVVETIAGQLGLNGAILPEAKPELPPFGSVERTLAVYCAVGEAGFVPTTNSEKNHGFKLLERLETPHGVHAYLMEIYDHTVKIERAKTDPGTNKQTTVNHAKELAQRAVISVIHEMGDELLGSMAEYDELEALDVVVGQTDKPTLTLAEVLNDHDLAPNRAAAAIVRYIDTKQIVDRELDLPITPFTDREERPSSRPLPGKNKTVMDPYTAAVLLGNDEKAKDYVLGRMTEITVKDMRKTIPAVMREDMKRANYWCQVLTRIKGIAYRAVVDSIFAELDNQAVAGRVQ